MDDGKRELEFLGTLGHGGFGTVYLANLHGRDRFVRRVAVKVLKTTADDPEIVARQRDEARLLGLLSHQAIVQVVDLTEVQGRPAVVMEYVEGIDLAAVVRSLRAERATVPPRAALDILAIAASALDAAYNVAAPGGDRPLRAIHRDIKPANLLLTAHGGVKVLDFGIARADIEREGATGSAFFGTAAYMAPEFWLQEPIGPAYDVYALGVTLLEMGTGLVPERPVLDPARYTELRRAQAEPLPAALAALALAMTAFGAADRPTAAEVQERAEALAGGMDGEPVSRFARRVVPPLLAARSTLLAAEDVPTRARVGVLEGERGGERDTLDPPRTGAAWYRHRRGLLVAAAALAGIGSAVVVGYGVARPPGREETALDAPPQAEPATPIAVPAADAPPSVVSPEAPVPATADVEPPPATPPAPERSARRAETPTRPSPAGSAPGTPALIATADPVVPGPPSASSTPPPETATARPAATSRRLSVSSVPAGAALEVDGAPRGATPQLGLELADGPHSLRLTLDGAAIERALDVGPDTATSLTYSFSDRKWRSVYR